MSLLTLARDLKRRRARERRGLFVVEGIRTAEEVVAARPIALRGAMVSPAFDGPRADALRQALAGRAVPVELVSDAEFASAAETESPQGVLIVAEVPERALDDVAPSARRPVIVLDGLQDPGNVGTILRSAAAFDAAATLALPGTVDLWNAKVVRSAMGALFHHPALPCTWDAFDAFRARHAVTVWGADARGGPLPRDGARPDRLALVVGNEGAGLSAAARERVDQMVALPIPGRVESLNAAVAAGIFLYELTR